MNKQIVGNSFKNQITSKLFADKSYRSNIYMLVKLATVVVGEPKAPFSLATPPRYSRSALILSLDCSTLPLIRT